MAQRTSRQQWIVDQVEFRPDANVVEIGCGHGVAATSICSRLSASGGRYVGIDRSQKMVDAATKRNRQHVEAGRATFVCSNVADVVPDAPIDLAVAIHYPPIDRGDPTAELVMLRGAFAPDGRLYVGFQPLDPASIDSAIAALRARLDAHGFDVVDVIVGEPDGGPAAVVITRPRRA